MDPISLVGEDAEHSSRTGEDLPPSGYMSLSCISDSGPNGSPTSKISTNIQRPIVKLEPREEEEAFHT